VEQTQQHAAPDDIDRSRTVRWQDPRVGAERARGTAGLELLRAIAAGEVPPPPVMAVLPFEAVEAEAGRVVFALDPAEFHYNPLGTVHGGVLATVLDSAAGCAVHSTLPAGTGYTSLDLSVRFVRAVTADSGRLRCEGSVLSRGRRTAVAEARLTDARDRLVAHATSTCLLLPTAPAA
jgi:uncharacterized protein (TIGR00369 family)